MKEKSTYLYCFSPLVMLSTFIIESGAALYILFRYRMTRNAQLIVALLSCLAVFQLCEYMVCTGAFYLSSLDWARLGYAAITLLPPLGIHLGLSIAKHRNSPLLAAAYGSSIVFMLFFLFVGHGMQAQQCLGNYVIFTIAPYAVFPYGIYYQGWLIAGVGLAWKAHGKISNKHHQRGLLWLVLGYLSFMIPSMAIYLIDRQTASGLPSIMCGFAVVMALCLLFKVAPLVLTDTMAKSPSRLNAE